MTLKRSKLKDLNGHKLLKIMIQIKKEMLNKCIENKNQHLIMISPTLIIYQKTNQKFNIKINLKISQKKRKSS